MGDGWETARKLTRPAVLEDDGQGLVKVRRGEGVVVVVVVLVIVVGVVVVVVVVVVEVVVVMVVANNGVVLC